MIEWIVSDEIVIKDVVHRVGRASALPERPVVHRVAFDAFIGMQSRQRKLPKRDLPFGYFTRSVPSFGAKPDPSSRNVGDLHGLTAPSCRFFKPVVFRVLTIQESPQK